MTTDRLTLAHVFEEAGFPREKAEAVASTILDAIHDNVATKTDLALAVRDLKIWTGTVASAAVLILLGALHFLR